MTRPDGRDCFSLRPIRMEPGYVKHAEGSVLISCGDTRVLCTATVEERVPPFLKGAGSGWVTAEYGMLPRSTETRNQRDSARGRPSGRSHEIQRLIGRSLRSVVKMDLLGERSILVDCDVIQADGGTRTTSVTGGFVALAIAVDSLRRGGRISRSPLKHLLTAVSVGIVDGRPMLDLTYAEDSRAEVDMNVVADGSGRIVEIQGTAEKEPFTDTQLFEMLEMAKIGTAELADAQYRVLAESTTLTNILPVAVVREVAP